MAAALAVAAGWSAPGSAGDAVSRASAPPPVAVAVAVENVFFRGRQRGPVRVMRGPARPVAPPAETAATKTEVIGFGPGKRMQVAVVRGPATAPAAAAREQTVTFADPHLPAVTVLRGPPSTPTPALDYELFGSASEGDLDRIAFAVDGVESRHGADSRMWRPEPDGPQGPMQISAAAALDVGGGNRFDLVQNRLLGRAYLAQMYRRYGNWPDALAAYNWGPGNLDQWIAAGRLAGRLPPLVLYYVSRVLRDALITAAARR